MHRSAPWVAGWLLTVAIVSAADAQPAGKAWRIGYLSAGSPPPPSGPPSYLTAAFRRGLKELGYTEGREISIEYRWSEGKSERLPALAAELVNLRVDVLFATSVPAALAAKQASTSIPTVFVMLGDPVAVGLVASLARPGGNLTGLGSGAGGGGEIAAKRLQLLKEIVPAVNRIGVLWNPKNPGNVRVLKVLNDAAGPLGVHLHPHGVPEPAALADALGAMAREPIGALLVVADTTFGRHRQQIADFALQHRLPSSYPDRQSVEAGGLLSYQTDLADMYRRAAGYVDKLLKGARPGQLPVELPTKFELAINRRTARTLGLPIPPAVLLRADHVVE